MKGLKIKKAIYYDPARGRSKGTNVKKELSSIIKDNVLVYQGAYNDIFPDHFKNIHKKLFIKLKYYGKKYTTIYSENETINLPRNLEFVEERETVLHKKSWQNPVIIMPAITVIIIAILSPFQSKWVRDYLSKPEPIQEEEITPEPELSVDLEIVRPLEPLETGKSIGELPNGVYFFSHSRAIVYEIKSPEYDFIEATSKRLDNFSFEIQKIENRYYLIGFVSDEAHSNIGSVDSDKSLYTILYPNRWGGATHSIAIPFDAIHTINDRTIDLDENTVIKVFDIGFKEVKDNLEVHAK